MFSRNNFNLFCLQQKILEGKIENNKWCITVKNTRYKKFRNTTILQFLSMEVSVVSPWSKQLSPLISFCLLAAFIVTIHCTHIINVIFIIVQLLIFLWLQIFCPFSSSHPCYLLTDLHKPKRNNFYISTIKPFKIETITNSTSSICKLKNYLMEYI